MTDAVFLTTKQAAKLLNISLATLKKFIYQGRIRTLKTPGGHHRILRNDLFALINTDNKPKANFPINTLLVVSLFTALLTFPCYTFAYQIGNLDVNVDAGIAQACDDNITFARENAKDDLITNLSVGLNAKYEGKLQNFSVNTAISRQNFFKYHNFDNTSENISLNYNQELTKHERINLKNTFLHAEEPRSFEDEFGRTGDRYSYSRNSFGAAYTRDISKQSTLIFNYINELYDYSRIDLNDSYLNRFSMEADYSLSSKTILLALLEYIHRNYEHTANAKTKRMAGGIREYFTSQFYFDLKAGRDFIRPADKQKSTGQFISASLTNEINKNTSFTISYLKENSTTDYSQNIFKSQRVSLSLAKQILEKLKVSLSGFYGNGEYSAIDTRDRLKGASTGFTYDLLSGVRMNASYSYSETSSNAASREYKKNFVSLGITYEF